MFEGKPCDVCIGDAALASVSTKLVLLCMMLQRA